MKVTMLGTGAYGLALSISLAKNKGNEITMWTERPGLLEDFKQTHRIDKVFEGLEIPENISLTTSFEEALKDSNLIFIGCAAKYVESVCKSIKPYYNNSIPICIASKGIEDQTCSFLSDLVGKTLNTPNIAVLSGPTFAIDIVNGDPIALTLAGSNFRTTNLIENNLACDKLKLRTTNDLIGVQVCGSVKNIIAIASGMVKGLGYSESTISFLINESLLEIRHLIDKLGGDKKTILSYAGVGDLILTCTSTKSRNYSFGYLVGSTKDEAKKNEYLNKTTVEGYYALSSFYKLAHQNNISVPIIDIIHDIIIDGDDPNKLTKYLVEKVHNTDEDLKDYHKLSTINKDNSNPYYYSYTAQDTPLEFSYTDVILDTNNTIQRAKKKNSF